MFDGATIGLIFSISAFGSLFEPCMVLGLGGWQNTVMWVNAFWFHPSGHHGFNLLCALCWNMVIGGLSLCWLYLVWFTTSACLLQQVWIGYFSELFPAHLRGATALLALFHGGRILGMWAPVVLIFIQEHRPPQALRCGVLQSYMDPCWSSIWLTLPETPERRHLR